jgi:hypothetical protein
MAAAKINAIYRAIEKRSRLRRHVIIFQEFTTLKKIAPVVSISKFAFRVHAAKATPLP